MIPLARWLRTDLAGLMADLLAPEGIRARGLFAPAAADRLVREHRSGARSHADRLWALMMAELWMRPSLGRRGRASPPRSASRPAPCASCRQATCRCPRPSA